MQVEAHDLEVLLDIQKIDLEVIQKKKARGELPQRIEVVKVRKKRDEIAPKLDQVAELESAKLAEITAVEDEDRVQAEKQERAQADIDAAGSDYRAVESHSRDMDGIVKRRIALEENLNALKAELAKIRSVRAQVEAALAACDKQEADLRSSFKNQDDAIIEDVRRLLAERAELAAALPADVLALYDDTAAKTGGVALGKLGDDGRCGVCRAAIEGGRLIELRANAPLGQCPNCKRLLIVGE